MSGPDALRTVAAFRLALPRTVLRFAGGRELTLGDLGARQGLLGGINAVIVGNYLTTLGRPAESDIDLLGELQMPIKASERDAVTAPWPAFCDQCGRPATAEHPALRSAAGSWSRPGSARTAPAGWSCR